MQSKSQIGHPHIDYNQPLVGAARRYTALWLRTALVREREGMRCRWTDRCNTLGVFSLGALPRRLIPGAGACPHPHPRAMVDTWHFDLCT
eukprot:7379914-Prymnesium_polylepis.2